MHNKIQKLKENTRFVCLVGVKRYVKSKISFCDSRQIFFVPIGIQNRPRSTDYCVRYLKNT